MESQLTGIKLQLTEEHYSEAGDFIRCIDKTIKLRNQWAHVDMLRIFKKLSAHLALICELSTDTPDYTDPDADLDPENLAVGIYTIGVIINGGDENLKVALHGFKLLTNDQQLDLKPPAVRIDGDYPFATQLLDLVQELTSEARKALYEQKGCSVQGNLFGQDIGEAVGASMEIKATKSKKPKSDFMDGLEMSDN